MRYKFPSGNNFAKMRIGKPNSTTKIRQMFSDNSDTIGYTYIRAVRTLDRLLQKIEDGEKLSNLELKKLSVMTSLTNKLLDKLMANVTENSNANLDVTFEDFLIQRKSKE